jgi:hypothetical protein
MSISESNYTEKQNAQLKLLLEENERVHEDILAYVTKVLVEFKARNIGITAVSDRHGNWNPEIEFQFYKYDEGYSSHKDRWLRVSYKEITLYGSAFNVYKFRHYASNPYYPAREINEVKAIFDFAESTGFMEKGRHESIPYGIEDLEECIRESKERYAEDFKKHFHVMDRFVKEAVSFLEQKYDKKFYSNISNSVYFHENYAHGIGYFIGPENPNVPREKSDGSMHPWDISIETCGNFENECKVKVFCPAYLTELNSDEDNLKAMILNSKIRLPHYNDRDGHKDNILSKQYYEKRFKKSMESFKNLFDHLLIGE